MKEDHSATRNVEAELERYRLQLEEELEAKRKALEKRRLEALERLRELEELSLKRAMEKWKEFEADLAQEEDRLRTEIEEKCRRLTDTIDRNALLGEIVDFAVSTILGESVEGI
jgi:seryl-tRNA synthetase